jgi:hypothetical protein
LGQFSTILLGLTALAGPKSDDGLSWHWDRETPTCTLRQQTADGDIASVSRTAGQDETSIGIVAFSTKATKGLYQDGLVTLPAGGSYPATIQLYSKTYSHFYLNATVKDPQFPHKLAESSVVTIAHPEVGKFMVPLRDLGPAMAAIRSCENAKMRDWGIDVDAFWALSSRPHPTSPLPDLFDSAAYPDIALNRNIERNVIAKLEIAADGSVSACGTPHNFAYPQFVDAVCKVLTKGARFEPARNSSGRAVAAPYVVIVSFQMGGY